MNFSLRNFEDYYGSPKPSHSISNHTSQKPSVHSSLLECTELNTITNNARRDRADSRNIASTSQSKRGNQDWIRDQARKLSAKEGAALTGLSERAFENIRLGRNKISFDPFTEWCLNDPDMAAAYAEHVGLILPGEAEYAGAITRAYNAYERRKAKT